MKTLSGNPPFRSVLFDLDGVLIDSRDVWFALMNAAAADFSTAPVKFDDFIRTWGQSVEEDARQFYAGRTAKEVEGYYISHFMKHAQHLKVNGDAHDVLAQLRKHNVPTGLLTNTPRLLAEMILSHAELHFDAVVAGGDIARPKPAPDAVLLGCRLLGVPPSQLLLVGDTVYDRIAAREAGAGFAGVGIEGDVTLVGLAEVLELCGIEASGAST